MKRLLIIALILTVINLPFSCDDGCGPFTKQETYIDSLFSRTGIYVSGEFSLESSIDFRFAAIAVVIEDIEFRKIVSNEHGFSLIHSTIACDPVEPEPAQTLQEISITCNNPIYFNGKTYPAQTNLNELFISYANRGSQIIDLDELITNHQHDPWFFSQPGDAIYLQLINKPDSLLDNDFIIDLTFSDGVTFSLKAALRIDN